jgi:drug/metabolite transporter (DMT)-like permease
VASSGEAPDRRPVSRGSIVLVYVGVAALWGSTWLVVRLGLEHLPPLLFAGVRMALAAVLLTPLAIRGGLYRLPPAALRRVAEVGLLQIAIPYGLLFAAQQWVPSALAAILFATFPVWITVVAWQLLPGERLTPVRAASVALGVAGVVVLEAPHLAGVAASGRLALGSALVVAASIVVAVANVAARRHLVAVSPYALVAGQSAVGAVALLAASALLERGRVAEFTLGAWGAIAYLAVFGTGLTYVGLYWLLPRISIAAVGAIPLLDTTVAVGLGAAVLGEEVGWPLAAGGAMVLAAAGLASRPAAGNVPRASAVARRPDVAA